MNIKRNIIFSLEKRKKDGIEIIENVPIRVRINYDGDRLDLSSGFRVDISKWDDKKQRVKNGTTNKIKQSASEINTSLLKIESIIQDIFKSYEIAGAVPSKPTLRNEINDKIKPKNETSSEAPAQSKFFDYYDQFIQENRKLNNWTEGTLKKLRTVRNHLQEFKPNIGINDFDNATLDKYMDFLLKRRGFKKSTLEKHLKFLKWFLRWGNRKGIVTNSAFLSYRPKIKKIEKKVVFLTGQEIDHIKAFDIPKEKSYLHRVRDILIFTCYSGLRHSDVYALTKDAVKEKFIEVVTIKTDDKLIIDLNNHTKAILNKYKDERFPNNKALPVISNQKYNEYLKELGELVGLDESLITTYYKGNKRIEEVVTKYMLLTSHIGRRSFICNGLFLGIPVHIMMKWTGHSDYKSMQPYIDTVDEMRSEAMEMFNKM